jgi:uncharacterized protein YfaS (alpha-2-macroglobulin family)
MAVNDAVLQLSGYRPPDLVKTIYSDQPITTRLADNRPQVVLAQMPSPLEKGWGYGGGQSQGLADTVVRRHFQPLAYYEGSVLTNAQGQAQVTFSLPDDLTIWRVMALATDGNLHFGQAESTFRRSSRQQFDSENRNLASSGRCERQTTIPRKIRPIGESTPGNSRLSFSDHSRTGGGRRG